MGDAVGPVGQLLIGTHPAIADQRDMITEAALHHAVGQLSRDIHMIRILKNRIVQQQVRPFVRGREMIPCERVDMGGWSKHLNLP